MVNQNELFSSPIIALPCLLENVLKWLINYKIIVDYLSVYSLID